MPLPVILQSKMTSPVISLGEIPNCTSIWAGGALPLPYVFYYSPHQNFTISVQERLISSLNSLFHFRLQKRRM